jgi:MraZ protein
MDAKGRLAMPTRLREPLRMQSEGQVVVTIDTQTTCLMIYPLPVWEPLEQEIQDLPSFNPAVKRFQRLMLGYATDLELDGSGRLLLPPSLRDYAKLDKAVVLVGQGKKMELWSESLWSAVLDQALQSPDLGADVPIELKSLKL